jgi:medium-chain acyl-[acyl-carrier-protein] hydrolase
MKSRWISYWRPNPQARLRLFCLPYAGGSAHIFRNWPEYLPDSVEVGVVHLPGRAHRAFEQPPTRLAPLAQSLTTALLPEMDKPFAIFGHSMGATIGFEWVRELRRRGGPPPLHLFVSGRPAPQVAQREEASYRLPDHLFIKLLRRLNGTPETLLNQPELMESLLPILRADFELLQTYVYSPEAPLDCPITAFGGSQDREVEIEELEAWRMQTIAKFSLSLFDGDHFFIHSSEPLLIKSLFQQMERLQKKASALKYF